MNTKTEELITTNKAQIVSVVITTLKSHSSTATYKSVWEAFEGPTQEAIITYLKTILPKDTSYKTPKSKSSYPDIEITNSEGRFAIDIKCAAQEEKPSPRFDMARIDTMQEKRLDKFVEEWEVVIKYEKKTVKFVNAYFGLFREFVGIKTDCNGILYRPYDGKVRPKSWVDFENEKIYWDTKEKFMEGFEISLKKRWKSNISLHLLPKLSSEEKKDYIKLFSSDSETVKEQIEFEFPNISDEIAEEIAEDDDD